MKISDWIEEKDIHSMCPLKGHSMNSTFIRAQKIPMGKGGEPHPHRQQHFSGSSAHGRVWCVVNRSDMAWFKCNDDVYSK